ncbi:MAG: hypothetical protein WCJ98_05600 [Mycobacteriaceae bacterium]
MTADGAGSHAQPPERRDDADLPLRVFSCSRLGLQANPPVRRPSSGGWLRRR